MNAWIIFQRMLILFAMMMVGFFSYRKGLLDNPSLKRISGLVVTIMNPLLILDGVMGKEIPADTSVVTQNILLMILYYVILLLISIPVARLLRVSKSEEYLYRLMMIFSNVGFMGIPVITSLYGDDCVLFIAFYILGYNLLLYTLGISLVDRSVAVSSTADGKGKMQAGGFAAAAKKICNPGVIACLIAILIFALRIRTPEPIAWFVNSMGGCAVPLSMVLIGASMAQQNFKTLFADKKTYLFLLIRMLVVPIIMALIMEQFALHKQVAGVFGLMLAMPVGSIVVLLAQGRGANEQVCTRASVISTLASVLTIPLIAIFLP
ncbi:MAG: AEC family transporter [Lachnospiraceae bacterium]|nr:AEC family transporter [Lachnospiraceae bacterium]